MPPTESQLADAVHRAARAALLGLRAQLARYTDGRVLLRSW
ncbi:hypothetical protein [Streptomyces flaveolus]